MLSSSRWLLTICFTLTCSSFLVAQETPSLPQNWKQLPAHEFSSTAIEPFKDRVIEGDERREVSLHAKELLLHVDISKVGTNRFQMLDELFELSRFYLDDSDVESMIQAMQTRNDDWRNRPYVEMRSKVAFMEWLKMPHDLICLEVENWFDLVGNSEEIWDEDLGLIPYYLKRDAQHIENGFKVVWEGRVKAPTAGEYKFYISPINVNGTAKDYHLQQSIKLSVAGTEVLNATAENWNSQSKPVALQADEFVALKYEMVVETLDLPPQALHAVLKWEGPGVEKSAIPKWQFRLPTAGTLGLRATYTWSQNGTEQELARVEDGIDYSWSSGKVTLSNVDTSIFSLWQKTTQSEFLNSLESGEKRGETHPLLVNPKATSEGLTSEQRKAFLNQLQARPALLTVLSPRDAASLYRSFRFGAPDVALDVFGTWAVQNANCECNFPKEVHISEVDYDNREAFRNVAIAAGLEQQDQIERLRSEYLELPNGSCVLPIAYTLSYYYLSNGEFQAWNDFLDSKLASNSTSGDQRVNWLLAKAHAKEIRLGTPKIRNILKERILDGSSWLEEAALVAQSPENKVRVARERAARLTAVRKFTEAKSVIQQASDSAPASLAKKVEVCQNCITEYESANTKAQSEQEANVKNAYLERLKKRRDKAQARGDTAGTNRYNSLIQAAENK